MRISYLHGSSDLYGASRMLIQEVCASTALGHRVSVVLPTYGPLVQQLREAGAEVAIEPELRVLRRVSPFSAVRGEGFDIPDSDIVVLWTLALLPEAQRIRRHGVKLGVSVHEFFDSQLGNVLRRYLRHLDVPVQCNSMVVARWLQAGGIPADVCHLTYPVVQAQTAEPRRKEAPSAAKPFTMLVMGRINGTKGHVEAVHAVRELSRQDARLLLAGSPFPGQEQNLKVLEAEVAGVPNVEMLGQISDLRHVAQEVDVLLSVPSRPESLGLQPLEFWELGVRAGGWAWGGQTEVLSMVEGILLPRAPDALAGWMDVLIENWRWVCQAPSAEAPAAILCSRDKRLIATAGFLEACRNS